MSELRHAASQNSDNLSAELQQKVDISSPPLPPSLPWLSWQKGERVVLRYRLEDGLHDALGEVVESAFDHVSINTRRGIVRVEASTMVTGKRVPPPPTFPGLQANN